MIIEPTGGDSINTKHVNALRVHANSALYISPELFNTLKYNNLWRI